LEYSRQYNASKSVGGKVEYGYLERLIDEKKKNGVKGCVDGGVDEYGW